MKILRKVHQDQIEAREIQERLLHGENVREIGLLAEAIEEEVQGIETVQQKQVMGFSISFGSVIISFIAYKEKSIFRIVFFPKEDHR